jgi:hypothetical protein
MGWSVFVAVPPCAVSVANRLLPLSPRAHNFCRTTLLVLAAAMLSGCSVTPRNGASFSALAQSMGPPKAGQARIIVFRDPAFAGLVDPAWPVTIDGEAMGKVKTGEFIYRDRPGGRHKLVLHWDPFPRPSNLEFDAVPGRTHVFRIVLNERGQTLQATTSAAGLAGMFITGAVMAATSERGSYDFVPVDPAALSIIRMAEESKSGG